MKDRIPFVIQGDFNKEFLESLGYKPYFPEPVKINNNPEIPMHLPIIEGLFPKIKDEDTST